LTDFSRFAIRLAGFAPLAALLVGVNYFVDPAHLFDRGRTEREIATVLSTGRRVTGLENYDERGFQRELAMRDTGKPETLVIGSSRAMTVSSAEIGTPGVRNAAVSGANFFDVLGIYQLYANQKHVPRSLVLGVDPWMFNANSGDTRWVSLEPEARTMLARLGLAAPNQRVIARARLKRAATLVSLDYFQQGVRELVRHHGIPQSFLIATNDSNVALTRKPDGSIVYGEDLRRLSQDDVARSARAYAETSPVYQLGGFNRIDPADSVVFDRFIRAARADGVDVTLLMAPYHPVVYDALIKDERYAMVAKAEELVRRVGVAAGVRVCGSYDPALVGLGPADFYDGMHARPEALGRMLRACSATSVGAPTR
jgi:hypothetical protein